MNSYCKNCHYGMAHSHRNLSAGIPVPLLIDVKGMTGGLAGSAAKTLMP